MLIDPFVMFHTRPLSSFFFNEAYDEDQFAQMLLKFGSIINTYYVCVALGPFTPSKIFLRVT